MNAIPWFADLHGLDTGDKVVVFGGVAIAAAVAGFIIDFIMRDAAFGPFLNAFLVLAGVLGGIYLRYRFFLPHGSDDLLYTIGGAIVGAAGLFLVLGLAKSRLA
jgi:hypothetical protein